MRLIVGAILLSLSFTTAAPSAAPTGYIICPNTGVLRREIEAALEALMDAHGYPGFAYAVAGRHGPVLEGGVGVANRITAVPMRNDTVFQIGSVTKMFTGALLARLAAQDRLELGDRLSDHWFAGDALAIDSDEHPVTLQAIATHIAGLPRYPANLEREDGDPILGYPLELMREAVEALPSRQSTISEWSYSNFGYGVLAQAIARSQDKPFETLMDEEIIAPAGLHDTGFALNEEQRARLATPYRDDDVTTETLPWQMGAMSAAGGLFSTTSDLAAFGVSLTRHSEKDAEAHLLQRAPLARQTPQRAYGLGMFVVDNYVEGIDVLWHGGDVDGYAGSLIILPDHGLAIAYMTNIGSRTASPICSAC